MAKITGEVADRLTLSTCFFNSVGTLQAIESNFNLSYLNNATAPTSIVSSCCYKVYTAFKLNIHRN